MERIATIMILNYNSADLLEEYLPSVVKAVQYAGNKHKIAVVDNASTDGSADLVARRFPQVQFKKMAVNDLLFSYNLAVRECDTDYVLVLNSDIRVNKDFLPPLLRHFDDPDVFAVTPRMIGGDPRSNNHIPYRIYGVFRYGNLHTSRILKSYGSEQIAPPQFNLFANGGASVFDKAKFLELGGFNRIFWPGYMEDNDISYLAWLRGWKTIFEPSSEVFHANGVSMGRRYRQGQKRRMQEKNSMIFILKNISDAAFLAKFFAWSSYRLVKAMVTFDRYRLGAYRDVLKAAPRVMRERGKVRAIRRYSDRQILDIIQRSSF